jgi:sec-independent protein translocase protein TatB
MFDLFTPSHLFLIAIAILIFIGPKDLPRFMHMAGSWTKKARDLAAEFREGLNNIEQQGKLEELRKEIAALRDSRASQLDEEVPARTGSAREASPPVASVAGESGRVEALT